MDSSLIIVPDWPAPATIVALTTTRLGGVSRPPFDSFNLGGHVGDKADDVKYNRQRLVNYCAGLQQLQWLDQQHTNLVVEAEPSQTPVADGCYTQQSGLACAVMTADCLPLLLCDKRGTIVAAVHAGWRGLAAGIIENSVSVLLAKLNTAADLQTPIVGRDLMVWLGPAISDKYFEVGPEVRQQFLSCYPAAVKAFSASSKANHYMADLYALARLALTSVGVVDIYGGEYCTYADQPHFYSYRRDGATGRMVTLIYRKQ